MLPREIPNKFNDRWNEVTKEKNWISRSFVLNFKPAGFFSRYQNSSCKFFSTNFKIDFLQNYGTLLMLLSIIGKMVFFYHGREVIYVQQYLLMNQKNPMFSNFQQ